MCKIYDGKTNCKLDFYIDPNTIVEQHKKHQHNKIDSILNKHSTGISSIDQIVDEIETYRKTLKSQPKETLFKE